jgi:hypothetical protein
MLGGALKGFVLDGSSTDQEGKDRISRGVFSGLPIKLWAN